jgi:uncharacterized protein YbaP (TraB family)
MSRVSRFLTAVLLCTAVTLTGLPAFADPVLWMISDEDSSIYLFGTVHILPPELEWQNDAIDRAFGEADTVWFEAPVVDPAGQMEMLRLVTQFGVNPPGQPLSKQISEETRVALEKLTPVVGLPLSLLEPFRPWMAAVTLTTAYVQAQGYDPESGVESVLWPTAEAAGKDLAYFETVEEQVRFFADLPRDVELAYFEQTVLEFDQGIAALDQLVSAWDAGDLETLDELMNSDMRAAAPEVYQVLLVERNREWVKQIRQILDGSGTHFIALGAGHFVGSEGVVELLRAEGVEVTGP